MFCPWTPSRQPKKIGYQNQERLLKASPTGRPAAETDRLMLVRRRKSRIYFLRRFFDYPIQMNAQTIRNLGLWRVTKIGLSYLRSARFPIRKEKNLEQFLINRFGRQLYLTFFKSYTEKVWGVPCNEISAEWGAQRIKGLSVTKAIAHFLKQKFGPRSDLAQKGTETSLIEQFLYPKFGPGQMWEEVAERVKAKGGQILTNHEVLRLRTAGDQITAVEARDQSTGQTVAFEGDYFFSTMPVSDLVRGLDAAVPENVREVSSGLVYRDFITVGSVAVGTESQGRAGPKADRG